MGSMQSYGGVIKIKGAADKNGMKNATCKNSLILAAVLEKADAGQFLDTKVEK